MLLFKLLWLIEPHFCLFHSYFPNLSLTFQLFSSNFIALWPFNEWLIWMWHPKYVLTSGQEMLNTPLTANNTSCFIPLLTGAKHLFSPWCVWCTNLHSWSERTRFNVKDHWKCWQSIDSKAVSMTQMFYLKGTLPVYVQNSLFWIFFGRVLCIKALYYLALDSHVAWYWYDTGLWVIAKNSVISDI